MPIVGGNVDVLPIWVEDMVVVERRYVADRDFLEVDISSLSVISQEAKRLTYGVALPCLESRSWQDGRAGPVPFEVRRILPVVATHGFLR